MILLHLHCRNSLEKVGKTWSSSIAHDMTSSTKEACSTSEICSSYFHLDDWVPMSWSRNSYYSKNCMQVEVLFCTGIIYWHVLSFTQLCIACSFTQSSNLQGLVEQFSDRARCCGVLTARPVWAGSKSKKAAIDSFYFIHLTIQEFLAAICVCSASRKAASNLVQLSWWATGGTGVVLLLWSYPAKALWILSSNNHIVSQRLSEAMSVWVPRCVTGSEVDATYCRNCIWLDS